MVLAFSCAFLEKIFGAILAQLVFADHLGYFLDRWLFSRYYAILTIRTKVQFPLLLK